ncbi:MAG: hypothetical protein RJB64_1384 [Pseudomonadota bacterium]
MRRRHTQFGISLIETLIGMVIVAIALAAGVPSFSTYLQNSQIRNAAESLQNGLSLARAEAARRNTNVQLVLGAASAWTVGCAAADASCPASIQSRSAAEGSKNVAVTTSQVITSTNAVATTTAFTTTLNFNGFGKASNLPPGNSAVFDVTNPVGGTCASAGGTMRCLRVVVSAGGQIRMCDPKLTTTNSGNPQSC